MKDSQLFASLVQFILGISVNGMTTLKINYTYILFLERTFLFYISLRTKDYHVKHQLSYFLLDSSNSYLGVFTGKALCQH